MGPLHHTLSSQGSWAIAEEGTDRLSETDVMDDYVVTIFSGQSMAVAHMNS